MADILTNLADLFNYKEYEGDLDEKEYGLVMMQLLYDFTKKYSSKSYDYIEKHFDDDCVKLEEKLLSLNEKQFEKYENAQVKNQLLRENIPSKNHKKVNLDYDIKTTKTVAETTIKNTIQNLRNEVKLNIQVMKDNGREQDFNLEPKLKQAIGRIKRTVKYETGKISQRIRRSVQGFKYGEDMLYTWQSAHLDTTCGWCLHQETLEPRRKDDWEEDHLNGNCELIPISDKLSAPYQELAYAYEDYFEEEGD
ncbi:MAG: hypothetical protein J6Y78_03025 [Paludibacteraceae bacterium]|nr:hypothetical protein [Paludibacteraceae bacterium]